jgi:predicted transposase/invertase (TIGR01784 family)
VVYLCPKYANDETPPVLREWLAAIDDTLDKEVDENNYQDPFIQRIFQLIEQDHISPEERARMFQEYNEEYVKREVRQEAKQEGKIEIARALLAEGMALSLIARVTGLPEAEIARLQETEAKDDAHEEAD